MAFIKHVEFKNLSKICNMTQSQLNETNRKLYTPNMCLLI